MTPRWIFVIGCYNSGTTLLEQILRQHPAIAGLPNEGQFLTGALVTPKSAGVPRLWAEKEELFRFRPSDKTVEAAQIKLDWIPLLDKPSAPLAVEKSPTHAARTLWLQRHFEQPFFIHIVRNGYAVALGIHDKVLAVYGQMPNLLPKAANQWARSLEIVGEDARQLQHFLEVRYEDLTARPIVVVTQIFHFLGLSPIAAELLEQSYLVHGLRSPIKNQNANRLAQMTMEQQAVIDARAGELLTAYGYR